MDGSKCYLKMHVSNVGYPFPMHLTSETILDTSTMYFDVCRPLHSLPTGEGGEVEENWKLY